MIGPPLTRQHPMANKILPALCFVLASAAVRAQETTQPSDALPQETTQPDGIRPLRAPAFTKGSKTSQAYAGYFNDLGPQDVQWGFVSAGVSYYFTDNMSIGMEASGYVVGQPGDDAAAGGLGLVFRHHVLRFDESTLFVDVVGSLFEATTDVPRGGTRFNFVTGVGLGYAHPIRENTYLLIGARYIHLSNAGIEGAGHNPALNGAAGYVGVMFTF